MLRSTILVKLNLHLFGPIHYLILQETTKDYKVVDSIINAMLIAKSAQPADMFHSTINPSRPVWSKCVEMKSILHGTSTSVYALLPSPSIMTRHLDEPVHLLNVSLFQSPGVFTDRGGAHKRDRAFLCLCMLFSFICSSFIFL